MIPFFLVSWDDAQLLVTSLGFLFLPREGKLPSSKRLSWYCWVDSILWSVFTKSLEVLGQGSWGHSYPYLVMGKLVPQTQSSLNYHIVRLSPTSLFLAQCGCNRLWRALGVGLWRWNRCLQDKSNPSSERSMMPEFICSHCSCIARVESLD